MLSRMKLTGKGRDVRGEERVWRAWNSERTWLNDGKIQDFRIKIKKAKDGKTTKQKTKKKEI